jgi:mannose-6-phosphate isomerase
MRSAPAGERGKEECWLVIAAEPDAKLGIGFDQALSAEAMRKAALDGSIENLLTWHPARPGDFFYIPAGTVHAIGAGIGLIEVQQNSDITYRLYDYGRPRELVRIDPAAADQSPRSPSIEDCRLAGRDAVFRLGEADRGVCAPEANLPA